MLIRKLSPNEVDKYRALRLRSLQTDPNSFHMRYIDALCKDESFFLVEMLDPEYGCYGAFDSGQLVGMVTLRRLNKHFMQLFSLYVIPEYRRKGVASQLLQNCFKVLMGSEIKKIQLTVMRGAV